MRFIDTGANADTADEGSPLIQPRRPYNYNSDSGVHYGRRDVDGSLSPSTRRHVYYGAGHYNATNNSSSDEENDDAFAIAIADPKVDRMPLPHAKSSRTALRAFLKKPTPESVNEKANRYTRRTRMRNMKKFRQGMGVPKLLRVSAYCTCDSISLFKLLKWLERVETGQLPGGELNPNGWTHKMHMGAIHSACTSDEREEDLINDEMLAIERKDVFYFATGCTVFWGLTRAEEQAHIQAIRAFSNGSVKQVEVEDMDFCYGDASSVINDSITLSSFRSSEKIAISFAMAQSSKLDVFEQRVDETIQETRHIPQTLADTGEIKKYSQKDISQLIGRLFIERSDINLNSDMLDDPDFFWDDDEYQPLYKKMMKYLDVDNRVHILNTRLDILRELLDVLSQQLARQHDTKLEWIVIWLIVAEVVVEVFWNILIKDILGFFAHNRE
ncbi:hypothetical protein H257_12796 [Aphanomyces astaci]|uniref:DUF155 domain-containing protein n=1 Tax=Aphanomyces astaci TaxID=112090 RepID=W4FYV7_APHAT|nr:hypothetical protein H257_12796 [Aphanomyces astaci]ETV71984.1 hypothetical protein H257_12796 [Aphanomyces astaci]|eukprot:XP_009838427.1 hypothetical protein H257_12796 [Aphanomyces astaci]